VEARERSAITLFGFQFSQRPGESVTTAQKLALVTYRPGRLKRWRLALGCAPSPREQRKLLAHRSPRDLFRISSGDVEQVFERALDLLLAQRQQQRFGKTDRPRKQAAEAAKPGSRYIPREVRRAVWVRCEGCCSFAAPDGERCRTRSYLEFHHLVPFGQGGPTTAENLTLMCQSHNALLAERDYGRELISHRISLAKAARSGSDTTNPGIHHKPWPLREPTGQHCILQRRVIQAGESTPPSLETD
jgi:5-methylcytosine-specific restriction endonuclease McrA